MAPILNHFFVKTAFVSHGRHDISRWVFCSFPDWFIILPSKGKCVQESQKKVLNTINRPTFVSGTGITCLNWNRKKLKNDFAYLKMFACFVDRIISIHDVLHVKHVLPVKSTTKQIIFWANDLYLKRPVNTNNRFHIWFSTYATSIIAG